MAETKHRGKIVASHQSTSGAWYSGERKAPGVTFRTDNMNPEEIAAESGKVRKLKICPACGGKKGAFSYKPDIHGDVSSEWDDCEECRGEGVVPAEK